MTTELTAGAPAADRIGEILRLLHTEHPDATCALDHRNALELLVATILSAQCTDERVNKVTPVLFERYPDAQALANADRAELEEIVRVVLHIDHGDDAGEQIAMMPNPLDGRRRRIERGPAGDR